jgi:hypothetical protein
MRRRTRRHGCCAERRRPRPTDRHARHRGDGCIDPVSAGRKSCACVAVRDRSEAVGGCPRVVHTCGAAAPDRGDRLAIPAVGLGCGQRVGSPSATLDRSDGRVEGAADVRGERVVIPPPSRCLQALRSSVARSLVAPRGRQRAGYLRPSMAVFVERLALARPARLLPRVCLHPLTRVQPRSPAGAQRVRCRRTPCAPAAPLRGCSPHPRIARTVRAPWTGSWARSRGYRRPSDITRCYAQASCLFGAARGILPRESPAPA